jgi:hypothetical protein
MREGVTFSIQQVIAWFYAAGGTHLGQPARWRCYFRRMRMDTPLGDGQTVASSAPCGIIKGDVYGAFIPD